MSNPLKILYVCSEVAPLVKTGGLGDVSNALPAALRDEGHDVRLAVPCYDTIPETMRGERRGKCTVRASGETLTGAWRETRLPETDVPAYLIEHAGFFHRGHPYVQGGFEYPDNLRRFAFFCAAVLDAVPQTGWLPDVVHCHDWHTALIPAYLKLRRTGRPIWHGTPTVLTVHNLGYQGVYPLSMMGSTGLSPYAVPEFLKFHGQLNLIKGGIACATKISTVSRTYAREIQRPEYGHGLHDALQERARDLTGIVNGVDYDIWHPMDNEHLAAGFSPDDMMGKHQCKRALQKMLNLPASDVPLFGVVNRMVWDKGVDLLVGAIRRLLPNNGDAGPFQVVAMGAGDPQYKVAFARCVRSHRQSVRAILEYEEAIAHKICAGSDFYVMPSRREPCGLSHLYAMAYGSVPIVRRTGGLADTVENATPKAIKNGKGTGIVFGPASEEALARAMKRACGLYGNKASYEAVQRSAMQEDFSWRRACEGYVKLYREAIQEAQRE